MVLVNRVNVLNTLIVLILSSFAYRVIRFDCLYPISGAVSPH